MLPDWLADLQIETTSAPYAIENATARGVLWQAARNRFLLDVPDVARYFVADGRRIVIERAPNANDADVMQFLRMTPLAALCFQRGILAFHAAAVAPPSDLSLQAISAKPAPSSQLGIASSQKPLLAVPSRGAILLAGDSGAGKSTLLAALLQRGWTMLADDLAVVEINANGELVVLPTFPDVRLWQDAREKLGIETQRIFQNASSLATPQALRAIYWLAVHNRDEIETRELTGAERFRALGTLTYNSHIADALLDRVAYFRIASVIAQNVPLVHLNRPRGKWSVDALAERLARNY
ncbi:MAG: hypothetical protein HY868_03545 [Chloroflexi bacterium]|nr:hypothetical protein [Chloroflexota bacterium]